MSDDETLLVDRYLDGELTPDARAELMQRLRADAAFRARFVAEVRLQGTVAGMLDGGDDARALQRRLLAALDGDGVDAGRRLAATAASLAQDGRPAALPSVVGGRAGPVPRPTRRLRAIRMSRARGWLALAACLALMAVGSWALAARQATSPVAIAELVAVSDAVSIVRDGAETAAQTGQPLRARDAIGVGAAGSASLRYADGTVVTLAAGTRATIDGVQAKQVRLERGSLQASVAKQPPGAPMVFSTPDARATVLGTRLSLAVTVDGSRLEVDEGHVAFTPLARGGSADDLHMVVIAGGEIGETAQGAVSQRRAGGLEPWAEALARVVAPTPAERAWESIAWSTDLWEARRRAHASGRPLMLWAGWGDPFAMATDEGLKNRQGAWADASLRRLIDERFIAIAGDSWFLRHRDDAIGRFFAELVRQSPHPQSDTEEGIYCFGADGGLLAFAAAGSSTTHVREVLEQAAAATIPDTAEIPEPGPLDSAHDPHPPTGALVALVSARTVVRDGDGFRDARAELGPVFGAASREALWLSPPEWRSLLPRDPRLGQRLPFPEALARKIACFALLDTTRGESSAWEPRHLRRLELALVVDEIAPTGLRLRVEGSLTLADSHRSYAPRIAGMVVYETARDAITRFDLVALGDYQAPDLDPAPPAGGLLGISISIAEPQMPLGHPHGMRDADYFAR